MLNKTSMGASDVPVVTWKGQELRGPGWGWGKARAGLGIVWLMFKPKGMDRISGEGEAAPHHTGGIQHLGIHE